MPNEPIPNDPTDDELESLAQDLLGVSLNERQDLQPFDVGAFDLDEVEPESPAEPADASLSDDWDEGAVDVQPVGDDFGASLLDDEDPPPASVAKRSSEPITARDEADQGDELGDELGEADEDELAATTEEPTSPSEADDDYWDALDGFDWDEGSDAQQPKSQLRKEYVETSDTFEDLSIESAEKSDEFLDDAEFGAGLDEEDSAPPAVKTAAGPDAESDRDAERKGRRRRGRRGRGRGRSQQTEEQGKSLDASVAGDEGRPDDDDEVSLSAEDMNEEDVDGEAEPGEDGFGAGLEIGDTDEDQPKKRRRRRGGRRRGRRKAGDDPSLSDSSAAESTADDHLEPVAEQIDPPAKKSTEDKYRSVPTWEDAISYLVRAEPKKSANGEKSGSGSRRGSRRGSGRRRST